MTKGGQQQGLCVKGRRMEVRGRGRRTKLIGVCVCVRGGIRAKKLGGMGGGGLYFYRGDPLQGVSRGGHFCWSRCVRHYEYGLVSGGGDGFQGVRLHDYPRSEYAENMSSKRSWARNQFSRSNREFVQGQVCHSGTIVNHFHGQDVNSTGLTGNLCRDRSVFLEQLSIIFSGCSTMSLGFHNPRFQGVRLYDCPRFSTLQLQVFQGLRFFFSEGRFIWANRVLSRCFHF